MKTQINFTVQELEKLKCPPTARKQILVRDSKVTGLVLRVTPNASKSYAYYRRLPKDNESPHKVCEITLGRFEDLRIEQARKRAEELNVMVGAGKDPTSKSQTDLTYDGLFRQYMEQYAKVHTSTWQNTQWNHGKYFGRFHDKPVSRIKRSEIDAWLKDLAQHSGKATANRNHNQMRAVFSWGLKRAVISCDNPCIGATRFKVQARERFIMPGDEFQKFAEALNDEPKQLFRDFFWMCLFTGARKSNVLAMEWQQVDFNLQSWRIPITKNGSSQTIPLTPNAMALLKGRMAGEDKHDRWVFPSDRASLKTGERGHLMEPKRAWERILARAGIEDLRIHDLRRTAGSYMAIKGISPAIIGKALGHKSPHSTAIYARLTQDPVRQALEEAQSAMAASVTAVKRPANVVRLRAGGNGQAKTALDP